MYSNGFSCTHHTLGHNSTATQIILNGTLTCKPITLSISLTSFFDGPMCRFANDSRGGSISLSLSWLSTGAIESARWRTHCEARYPPRAPNRRVSCRNAITGSPLFGQDKSTLLTPYSVGSHLFIRDEWRLLAKPLCPVTWRTLPRHAPDCLRIRVEHERVPISIRSYC